MEEENTESLQTNDSDKEVSDANHEMISRTCNDYAAYMNLNIDREKLVFDDSLEDMLTKLDEFCRVVDMVRSDTNVCLGRTLPQMYEKCQEMETIFEKIDSLEKFVIMVKKNVADVEHQVELAEDEMGSLSSIKKVFSGIYVPGFLTSRKVQKKTKAVVATNKPKFVQPEIFHTDTFLKSEPRDSAVIPETTFHVPAIPVPLLQESSPASSKWSPSEYTIIDSQLPDDQPETSSPADQQSESSNNT